MKTKFSQFALLMFFWFIFHQGMAQSEVLRKVYYVSESGNDNNPGTIEKPWRTVQKAADNLAPGDTVFLRGGVYREYVKPIKGGSGPDARVTYKAYRGETPVITGSDQITKWKDMGRNVWKAIIPDTLFHGYNPYTSNMEGEFLFFGQENHVGDVFLNGDVFNEVQKYTDVEALPRKWFTTHYNNETIIYANFGGFDPNAEMAEVLVRECVFFPAIDGLKYITLDGITFRHAATNWVEYHGLQKAIVGTRMGYKWIIENCHIYDGKTCGISSGQGARTGRSEGRSEYGYHIFRNNLVERCGQAGFIGAGGYFASVIDGNLIQDINYRRQFSGAESAGIKMHSPIDVTISNNIIRRIYLSYVSTDAAKGIWMDFAGQGFRITGNVLYDIDDDAMNLEACHGPGLVDNNIVIGSPISSGCEGLILVHNLLIMSGLNYHNHEQRSSGYYVPHTQKSAGRGVFSPREDRYFNNIFVGMDVNRTSLPKNPIDFKGGNNVFLKGAIPSKWEIQSIIDSIYDPSYNITDLPNGVKFNFTMNTAMFNLKCPLITREFAGINSLTKQGIEEHDGSPITIDKDMLGTKRNSKKNVVGPFSNIKPGVPGSYIVSAGPENTIIENKSHTKPQARIKRGGGYPIINIMQIASTLTMEQLKDTLKKITPVDFLYKDKSAGTFQYAISGEYLAVRVTVTDARITPDLKEWPEASVDVFASLPGGTNISQVAFHLGGIGEKRRVTFHVNGIEKETPVVNWDVKPLTESGYELTALIPLKQMKLSSTMSGFLFEGAFYGSPAKGANVQYKTLFGSFQAFKYNTYYSLLLIQK